MVGEQGGKARNSSVMLRGTPRRVPTKLVPVNRLLILRSWTAAYSPMGNY
jgi:hypothetical protein